MTVAVVPPLEDPRLQARRLEVKFEELRRDRASKPLAKTPGPASNLDEHGPSFGRRVGTTRSEPRGDAVEPTPGRKL